MVRACLLSFALALCGAAAAAPPRSVFLEELTWMELRDAIAAGATTVLVPIGGTEQSGPHIALGKHNVRARALAGRIAAELGNAIVAPVVAYVPEGRIDPPSAHMRFPGTITVPDEAFERVLESAARSFRRHGFRDIVLLGDHGGYQADLKSVAQRLNREWKSAATRAHASAEYYRASESLYLKTLEAEGFKASEIGTHAGLADTSLTLAIDPSLVRTDRLEEAANASSLGVDGDPRRASAALGEQGVQLIVERTVREIREAIARR